MKKRRVFSFNPILLLALIGMSAFVYQSQKKDDVDKVEIISSKNQSYTSGSLVETSKEILVENLYREGQVEEIKEFLISLPSRVLIYLNDQWIKIVDNKDVLICFDSELDQVLINYEQDMNIKAPFYETLGEIIYFNHINEQNAYQIQAAFEAEGYLFDIDGENITLLKYFEKCVHLFFTEDSMDETYPHSFEMITGVLHLNGII